MSFKKKPQMIQVQKPPQQTKLFVATPMYGGMSHGLYVKSCLDLQTTMMRYG